MAVDMHKVQQDIATEGAFHVIRRYVREGVISSEEASNWVAQVFGALGVKVAEAKTEIRRIEKVLERLTQVCARGRHEHPIGNLEPMVLNLAQEITALDGWMISLYETELTMLTYVNPARAKAKPIEMARSMEALAKKRMAGGAMSLKGPELFKLG